MVIYPVTRRPNVFVATCVLALGLVWPTTQASGQQRGQPTPDIHYVPTPTEIVTAMLTVARVGPDDVVYDLGSGDGRIVVAAARAFGATGVGFELDAGLVRQARENARKAGVTDRVSFVQADLFATDLSRASVVTLYLSPSINLRLRPKLLRELRPGARIVSHRFPIGDWTPDQDLIVNGTHVYFWTVPAP